MNTGEQLARVERFAQVVVGADFQSHDAVHVFALGREHDDGRAVAVGAQAAADGQAILAGHHQVEHDDVDRVTLQNPVEGFAVFGQHDFKAFLHEVTAQQIPDADVVVNDEYFVRTDTGLWHGSNFR